MKKLISLAVFLVGLLTFGVVTAAPQQRVGLILQDYSGNVEAADYKEFRYVTKLTYNFSQYQLLEKGEVADAQKVLAVKSVDRPQLLAAAEANNLDVVVLVRVYDYLEIIDGSRTSLESGPIVRVEAEGDLLVYRRDSGKVLVDKIREREFCDLGTVKHPQETFKWRLSDLLNKMEGRELIR